MGRDATPDGLGLLTRFRTWREREALDSELAAGADPQQSLELRLRASQVTVPPARRRAAAALEEVVDRAEVYGPAPKPPVPLRTQAVIDARAGLLGLAQRLRDDEAVGVRPAAAANHLLSSPDSPLYSHSATESAWDIARRASIEIDDERRLRRVLGTERPGARLPRVRPRGLAAHREQPQA